PPAAPPTLAPNPAATAPPPAPAPAKFEAPAIAPSANAGQATPPAAIPGLPPGIPGAPPQPSPPASPSADGAPPASTGAPRLRVLQSAMTIPRDTPFTVNVLLENAPDGTSGVTPLRIHWDASKLRLNDIQAGELLSRDGIPVTTQKLPGGENAGDA